QAELRSKGQRVSLGKLCVEAGLVTREVLQEILKQQSANLSIPGYEILSKLGEGGMGAVYRARQISMNRLVALKILPRKLASNAMFIKRFIREARTAARLNHPNVITAIDVGEAGGIHYFAMEFVPGCTLKSLMESKGPLDELYAVHIIEQICQGLEHATREGIIHRDIKPDNILLTSPIRPKDDETPETGLMEDVAKIVDMGLAKYNDEDQTMITQAGATLGTPHYISPEQALGEQDIDFRADIYSLGATFYHMVTGKTPFQGNTVGQIVTAHISKPLVDPREIRPDLSEGCSRVIQRMMQKKKDNRYANHQDLLTDLRSLAAGRKISARPVIPTADTLIVLPGATQVQRPRGRSGKWFVLPLLLAAGYAAYQTWGVPAPEPTPKPETEDPKVAIETPAPPATNLAQDLFESLAAQEPPSPPHTPRILHWRRAIEELGSCGGPAEDQIAEAQAREDKAKKDLDLDVAKVQGILEAEVRDHAGAGQWLEGGKKLASWTEALREKLPDENLDLVDVSVHLPPERPFWNILRNSFDADMARALQSSSDEPLKKWKQSQLPDLVYDEQPIPLASMIRSRIKAVEASLSQDTIRIVQLREAGAKDLSRWNPLDSLENQLDVLHSLIISGGSLKESLSMVKDILEEARLCEEALLEAGSILKGVTLYTGKAPSRKTWKINGIDRTLRKIRVESDDEAFMAVGRLPLELMRRMVNQAKLPTHHVAHARPDSIFQLLLVQGRLDEAANWLAGPEGSSGIVDEAAAQTAWRLCSSLQRWGSPCLPLPDGALHFKVDCGSSTRFRTLLWEGPPGTPLETDAQGQVHLKGHTLSFIPTIDIGSPWMLGLNTLPAKGSSLDVILECGMESTRISLGQEEGRLEVASRTQVLETRRFEAPLSIAQVPLDLQVAMEIRDGHPHAILKLQGQETVAIRLASAQGPLRVRIHSKGWSMGAMELCGVPRIR
ncbi:MAG: serine/threonine protein kinase, partial [Planctomycetota bacterium]